MFLGFSTQHSSTVGLILNIRTGAISPQFHIVYDEWFETVTTDMVVDLEETWLDLWMNARDFYLEEWDPEIDGPLPIMMQIPDEQPEEDRVDVKRRDMSIRTPSWHDIEEAPPRHTKTRPIVETVEEDDEDNDVHEQVVFEEGEEELFPYRPSLSNVVGKP